MIIKPLHMMMTLLLGNLLLLGLLPNTYAKGIYQTPKDFILAAFDNNPPKPKAIWVKKDLKTKIAAIMGHPWPSLRIRYWQKGQRSAWVLDEIGKELPITAGIIVNQDHIEQVKILIFRESRGWEVRHPFFTDQFKQATLNHQHALDKTIDGISGATLSVRAITKLSRLALFLHQTING